MAGPTGTRKFKYRFWVLSAVLILLSVAAYFGRSLIFRLLADSRATDSPKSISELVPKELYNADGSWNGAKVALIGVDGLDFDLADRLISQGKLPNLAKLSKEGASGKIRTWNVTISPTIWTIIATGVHPDKNGINNYITKDPESGQIVPMNSTMRKTPAIWQMASQAGLRVLVVNYWCTWPAEAVNGMIVSDWANLAFAIRFSEIIGRKDYSSVTGFKELTYPDNIIDKVFSLGMKNSDITTQELAEYLRTKPDEIGRIEAEDAWGMEKHIQELRLALASDIFALRSGLAMFEEERPDLFIVYFKGVDIVSHHFWEYYQPEKFPDLDPKAANIAGEVIDRYYEHTDKMIGELLAEIPPDYYVIVISDHGFRANDPGMGVSGTHALVKYASLYAKGPGIKPGLSFIYDENADIADCSVTNITPTILTWLSLPLSENFDAGPCQPLVTGLPAPVTIKSYRMLKQTPLVENQNIGEMRKKQLERLKALGYIE